MKVVVIDRKKWLRGKGGKRSALLMTDSSFEDDNGKMCCLGHVAKACGVTDDQMCGVKTPAALKEILGDEFPQEMNGLLNAQFGHSSTAIMMTVQNDNGPEQTREEIIIAEGRCIGLDISFIN